MHGNARIRRGLAASAALALAAAPLLALAAAAASCPPPGPECQSALPGGNSVSFTFRLGSVLVGVDLVSEDGSTALDAEAESAPGARAALRATFTNTGNASQSAYASVSAAEGVAFDGPTVLTPAVAPAPGSPSVASFPFALDACPPSGTIAIPFVVAADGHSGEEKLTLASAGSTGLACNPLRAAVIVLVAAVVATVGFVVLRRKP